MQGGGLPARTSFASRACAPRAFQVSRPDLKVAGSPIVATADAELDLLDGDLRARTAEGRQHAVAVELWPSASPRYSATRRRASVATATSGSGSE